MATLEIKTSSAIEEKFNEVLEAADAMGVDIDIDLGLYDQYIDNQIGEHTADEAVMVGYNLAGLAAGKPVYSVTSRSNFTYYFIGSEEEILKRLDEALVELQSKQ